MKRVYIETYGCSSNQADSEIIQGLLKKEKYDVVDNPKISNLNIINTCVVKEPTQSKMIFRIKELVKLNKPFIVAGCMPKIERNIVERIAPKASMLGPDSIQKVVDMVSDTLSGKKVVFLEDLRKPKLCLPRSRKNSTIHITPISIGCTSVCSYCCVRFARGRLYSYSPDLIIRDIKKGLNQGCKEVWVTSQDNGSYEFDGFRLPQLLNKISRIEGKFFVRVGMMNPSNVKDMSDELIDAYESDKIFKFLHLPVQSGSNRVLKMMNRNYTVKEFRRIVKSFRKMFTPMTLSTDVIVGFPGESEKDFQKTVDLIKEIKPDVVNISNFGPRPDTKSARMKQLSRDIVKKRTKKLVKIVENIEIRNNRKWLGWSGEVLIDERGRKGRVIGRNFAYKPVVTEGRIGSFKRIEITDTHQTYLVGK